MQISSQRHHNRRGPTRGHSTVPVGATSTHLGLATFQTGAAVTVIMMKALDQGLILVLVPQKKAVQSHWQAPWPPLVTQRHTAH
jgi:hypothetical protein